MSGGSLFLPRCGAVSWPSIVFQLAATLLLLDPPGRVLGGGLPALALCTPSGKVMLVGY